MPLIEYHTYSSQGSARGTKTGARHSRLLQKENKTCTNLRESRFSGDDGHVRKKKRACLCNVHAPEHPPPHTAAPPAHLRNESLEAKRGLNERQSAGQTAHATPCGREAVRRARSKAGKRTQKKYWGKKKETRRFFFFPDQSGTDVKDVTSSVPLSGRAG